MFVPWQLFLERCSVRRRTIGRYFLAGMAALVARAMPAPLSAQQSREITGKGMPAGGTPLTEATISIVGAQLGVRTNERGEYRLKAPAGDAMVVVRAIGFKRQTIRVGAAQSS